ncbi:multiple epidermal growth factor-like domains protein 9 isoform X2 [Hemibagrus wyckioides]|uniref:multiple epidermal growth factor-like domains protein 9 isoform X2 n=1 Tax=Hemibagrus wyckioides TaxID=337641 RepID=UPI00266CAE70|nr:multiple epidermal growth factor-like domains protein 9 isoform X2 [Hemibagrus wyckioides]
MLVFPLFKLLLLACTTGWSRALRPHGRSVARHARAVSDNQLEVSGTTTSPNHLPEEKLTSPPFPITPEDMTRNDMVTVAPSPKTMAPTLQNSTKLNISITTTVTSLTPSSAINTAATTDFTTTSTITPDLTTEKGPQCNCSTVGSVSPDSCDPLTGGCKCLPGYSGPRCDQCYSGYFRNRTGGCQPCDCDPSGAVGPQCNSSGVCECKAGVYGDKCDICQPGFFNFSSAGCQACQCNNHSNTCDKQSDETGQPVCDQCKPEYKGFTCVDCQDGYYNADSICVPCECNGNAEPNSAPRICHPDTGVCLNCSYNTTGPHCQHCAPGFTGDALARNCTAIVPTTPVYYSTMTPSPNVTDQLPTSSTTLLSSLSPSANSTTIVQSSWAQFNIIVLAVLITLILALLGAAGGIYTYRQYQNRKINAPFWTIELKEDNISFSSYHDSLTNADASGLLDDEACEAASNGQLTLNSPGSLYMP